MGFSWDFHGFNGMEWDNNNNNAYIYIYVWLVVLTILKNMKVNGKDYPIYYGK